MKERTDSAKYKSLYKRETGEYPKWWHIHHIDGDPMNNDINNLVCLTPEVHTQLHRAANAIYKQSLTLEPNGICYGGQGYNAFLMGEFNKFMVWYDIAQIFVNYRDFLLGRIPNIENTSYDELGKLYFNPQFDD